MLLSTGRPTAAKTQHYCFMIILLCCFKGAQQQRVKSQVLHSAIVKLDEKITDFFDNKLSELIGNKVKDLQQRFNDVDDYLKSMNTKIAGINQTLSFIEERLGHNNAAMDQKMERVHNRMDTEQIDLDQNMSKMHNSMTQIGDYIDNIKGDLVHLNDKAQSTENHIKGLIENSTENSVSSLKQHFERVIREQIVNELQEVKQNTENVSQINSDMIYLKDHIDKIEQTVLYLNDDNENIKQYQNRTYEVFQNIEKHENYNSRHLKSLKFEIILIGRNVKSSAENIRLYQNSTNEILKNIEICESDNYNSTHKTLKNIEIHASDNHILLQTINHTTHTLMEPRQISKTSELISGKTFDENFRNESLKYLSTIHRYTKALQDPISVIKQMILFNSADGIHNSQLMQNVKNLTEILQESLIKSVDNIQKDIKNFENAHATSVTNIMNTIANVRSAVSTVDNSVNSMKSSISDVRSAVSTVQSRQLTRNVYTKDDKRCKSDSVCNYKDGKKTLPWCWVPGGDGDWGYCKSEWN